MAFALKVFQDWGDNGDQDLNILWGREFSSEDIWDIGGIAAFFALSNRTANLINMRPNDEFYALGR